LKPGPVGRACSKKVTREEQGGGGRKLNTFTINVREGAPKTRLGEGDASTLKPQGKKKSAKNPGVRDGHQFPTGGGTRQI